MVILATHRPEGRLRLLLLTSSPDRSGIVKAGLHYFSLNNLPPGDTASAGPLPVSPMDKKTQVVAGQVNVAA